VRLLGAAELPSVLFRFLCDAGVVKKEEDMVEGAIVEGEAVALEVSYKTDRRTFFLTPTGAAAAAGIRCAAARAPSIARITTS
jgi:hypothetical protein